MASQHDTVAAYVGGELRGKAKVVYSKGKAYVALMVNVDSGSNTASLKIYDASADKVLAAKLGGVSSFLVIPAGSVGTGASPASIESTADTGGGTGSTGSGSGPFSDPVQYPKIPAVVIAKVRVNGQAAAEGDLVAAYVGEELRGKGTVVMSDGVAYAAVTVNVSAESENAAFKIWDKSEEETKTAYVDGNVTASISPGGSVGSWGDPAVLDTVPGQTTPTNTLPVANAGSPQTVTSDDLVTLTGSDSEDDDGDGLQYNWSVPAGSGIVLSNSNGVNPTFSAPDVNTTSTYTFSLVVNDGKANSANTSTVTITVNPKPETTSPNDLPFTAVDFGSDADRLAKWKHTQNEIEIEVHYLESETAQSGNSAIRKLVITSGGTAQLDLVNTPDWNLFDSAAQIDRAYHVGTDGSTIVASRASDLFSIAANDGSNWVMDIAQQANNRGRLTLGDGFSKSGNWEFISDEALETEDPLPLHSIQSIRWHESDSEIMVGLSGFDNLEMDGDEFEVADKILTLDIKVEPGSDAEAHLFSGLRWTVASVEDDQKGNNGYMMHLETEGDQSHGLYQSHGVLDISKGLRATSTWVDTGDTKSTEDDSTGGGGDGEVVISQEVTSVTASVGGNVAFTMRATGANAYKWVKDIHGERQELTGAQSLTTDWVEFPFYYVNASKTIDIQVKPSRLVKGRNTYHMKDGTNESQAREIEAPTLYLYRGITYTFNYTGFESSSHPFYLASTDAANWQSGSKVNEYTDGVTSEHNRFTFNVPPDAPNVLYYHCASHEGMGGRIEIYNQGEVLVLKMSQKH